MKIAGQEIKGPCVETLVLSRESGPLAIKAQGLPDFDEFDALCPEPKAPGKLTKNGWEPNLKDENYRSVLNIYNEKKLAYIVVRSLEASEIEWDTVDINNPKTWVNYRTDLKNAGFSEIEVGRIVQTVLQANALDETKLEKAREVFLAGQRLEAEKSSGPADAQATT